MSIRNPNFRTVVYFVEYNVGLGTGRRGAARIEPMALPVHASTENRTHFWIAIRYLVVFSLFHTLLIDLII